MPGKGLLNTGVERVGGGDVAARTPHWAPWALTGRSRGGSLRAGWAGKVAAHPQTLRLLPQRSFSVSREAKSFEGMSF